MNGKLARSAVVFVFSATFIPPLLAQDSCSHPRIISVTGNAEVKAAPDEVSLTLGVDSHDRDLAVAKVDNDKRIGKLLKLAHAAGVDPKNIQTSALSMGPEYSDEKLPKLLGFQVSQTVTITLTDISKYEDLMTNSLKAGVNRVDGINFFIAETKKYREDARLKAVQAAREKAVAIAGQLGQTVGKPWEITEGTDIDANDTTANVSSSIHYKLAMPQQEPTVAGGEIIIRAFVRVSFQLE
jgi:uncharacterized protein YggE